VIRHHDIAVCHRWWRRAVGRLVAPLGGFASKVLAGTGRAIAIGNPL